MTRCASRACSVSAPFPVPRRTAQASSDGPRGELIQKPGESETTLSRAIAGTRCRGRAERGEAVRRRAGRFEPKLGHRFSFESLHHLQAHGGRVRRGDARSQAAFCAQLSAGRCVPVFSFPLLGHSYEVHLQSTWTGQASCDHGHLSTFVRTNGQSSGYLVWK